MYYSQALFTLFIVSGLICSGLVLQPAVALVAVRFNTVYAIIMSCIFCENKNVDNTNYFSTNNRDVNSVQTNRVYKRRSSSTTPPSFPPRCYTERSAWAINRATDISARNNGHIGVVVPVVCVPDRSEKIQNAISTSNGDKCTRISASTDWQYPILNTPACFMNNGLLQFTAYWQFLSSGKSWSALASVNAGTVDKEMR